MGAYCTFVTPSSLFPSNLSGFPRPILTWPYTVSADAALTFVAALGLADDEYVRDQDMEVYHGPH